jgi:hypothetical protein
MFLERVQCVPLEPCMLCSGPKTVESEYALTCRTESERSPYYATSGAEPLASVSPVLEMVQYRNLETMDSMKPKYTHGAVAEAIFRPVLKTVANPSFTHMPVLSLSLETRCPATLAGWSHSVDSRASHHR